jgi:hypothetical protein
MASADEHWAVQNVAWVPDTLTATKDAPHDNGTGSASASATDSGGARRPRGRRGRACSVPGCALPLDDAYGRKVAVCKRHRDAVTLVFDGEAKRFCFRCGAFNLVAAFEGDKRSCREKVEAHNALRRQAYARRRRTQHRADAAAAQRAPMHAVEGGRHRIDSTDGLGGAFPLEAALDALGRNTAGPPGPALAGWVAVGEQGGAQAEDWLEVSLTHVPGPARLLPAAPPAGHVQALTPRPLALRRLLWLRRPRRYPTPLPLDRTRWRPPWRGSSRTVCCGWHSR